jgi:hypothetical protein
VLFFRQSSYSFRARGLLHGYRMMGTNPNRIAYMTIPAGFAGL